jgi:hypothetical protein
MTENPLESLDSYSHFVAELLDRPTVERSTVAVWSESPYTGVAEGEIFFSNGLRLRVREELDFENFPELFREIEKLAGVVQD